jgi:hypothetical protein
MSHRHLPLPFWTPVLSFRAVTDTWHGGPAGVDDAARNVAAGSLPEQHGHAVARNDQQDQETTSNIESISATQGFR